MAPKVFEKTVLVAGATGYVGGRLVPRLLDAGYHVRAIARSPEKLSGRPWSGHPALHVVKGDLLDPGSLKDAAKGCLAVYYLVHSMKSGMRDFAHADRQAATNMVLAAEEAGLERIIYLSGLGEEEQSLSPHLRSRAEVARILRAGSVPVTVLRAAMVIGSGSASFEILRYLVDRLPVMILPRWVNTPCQPIGIRNVLRYLVGCLEVPETAGETFDIGQEEIVNYRRLMEIYAEEAGLRKRLIIPLPFMTLRLSAYWISLITPVPASLARPLGEGLRNRVVCRDRRIRTLIPQQLLDCRTAIRLALERIREQRVESSWADAGVIPPAEWCMSGDPSWAGGTIYDDARRIVLEGGIEEVWKGVISLGGKTGWYYADWLWKLRGFFDRLTGGVGLQRGRRCPIELYPGDALDFWRAVKVEKPNRLLLVAEMKVPGNASLEFRLAEQGKNRTEVILHARFLPKGLAGIFYWKAVTPFHDLVFNGLLRGIGESLEKTVIEGPEHLSARNA